MHRTAVVLLVSFLGACALPVRLVDPRADHGIGHELTLPELADRLAAADVVVLGEVHDNRTVHQTHLLILQALQQRRPELVVALEMFERDVQAELWQYLAGASTETEFLALARPWPNYRTDYRPIVEWAKAAGVPVIAANVPRPLAAKVAKEGLEAVAGQQFAATEVSAPQDEYFAAFRAEMRDNGGAHGAQLDDAALQRMYQAQCLKDDTMAESIVQHLREAGSRGAPAFMVHVCGRFHSDYGRGTVARVRSRLPAAKVVVLSVEEVADPGAGVITADQRLADFVLIVPKGDEAAPKAQVAKATAAASPHQPKADQPAAPPAVGDSEEGEARPGLGIQPDYDSTDGMRVARVSDGGPAQTAGLHEDDVILSIAGNKVTDIGSYVAALGTVKIGQLVQVVVLRGGEQKEFTVKVGQRNR